MKHIKILLICMSLPLLWLVSCEKSPEVEGWTSMSKNFITQYFMPSEGDTIMITPKRSDIVNSELPEHCYGFGIICSNPIEGNNPELMARYADTAFNSGIPTPNAYDAIGKTIVDITIEAVDNYNDNYPAGACLDDISYITYASYYPFIQNEYNKVTDYDPELSGTTYDVQYGSTPYRECIADMKPMILTSLLAGTYFPIPRDEESSPRKYGVGAWLGTISMSEPPESSEMPEIEVIVTFDDGTVLISRSSYEEAPELPRG